MQTSQQTSQHTSKQPSKRPSQPARRPGPRTAQVLGPAALHRLAQLSIGLKPFQALDYDPATGSVVITTETLVALHETEKIARLVADWREGERLRVRRFPDGYKVTTVSEVTL